MNDNEFEVSFSKIKELFKIEFPNKDAEVNDQAVVGNMI